MLDNLVSPIQIRMPRPHVTRTNRFNCRCGSLVGFLPCRGMRDGRLGDGGGEGPSAPRRGLNRGDSEEVDDPTDVMEDTERVGDLIRGFILEAAD